MSLTAQLSTYSKVNSLLRKLRSKGYKIFDRPLELNLIAERSDTVRSEVMDDSLHMLYKDLEGKWVLNSFQVTTDPSAYYIDNPIVSQGYGFIKKGQWLDAYSLGYHKGRPALVQVKPMTVIRNYALKGIFKTYTGTEETGIFGNNIHDMKGSMINASAGCVVFARDNDYQQFLNQCQVHRNRYGNAFTLSLLDFRDNHKSRNTMIAASLLGLGGLATILFKK
ncbi:hypothetical protein PZB74_20750 [Porifericola rhodea]|uniref:hypothetical protein n=1 Tax=Porifericola rhodea TaxID=930972 RepID=UPI0026658C60|nr:hypothetical protein [Porifericola rhodea]WKN31382.1 hypothetical protein PZB74_20750 [Porifericola rhodea]